MCSSDLTNVARHAHAENVVLRFSETPQEWQLTIADDGCGMTQTSQGALRSSGLIGMRERTLAIGGDLAVDSAPGEGTIVRVRVPKPAADDR